MSSNLDREVLLRVKTDVQGIPQVEQLSGSLQSLAPAGAQAQKASEPLSNTLRDVETRATAANQSMANTARILTDVTDAIDDAQNLFELLKLEYIEGNLTLEEYNMELAKLRESLNQYDGESTRLIRTKRAVATEQNRLTQSSKQVAIGFQGTSAQASSANSILFESQNLVRGLNGDFPAMAQSVVPVLRSFNQLTLQSGGAAGALRSIVGVMGGPMGIVFALGSLLPTAIIAAQNFLSKLREDSDETADSIDVVTRRVLELIKANAELEAGPSAFSLESKLREIEETKQLISLLEDLNQAKLNLKNAETGDQSERGIIIDEDAITRAKQNIKELKSLLGPNVNADINALKTQLANLESDVSQFQGQINKNSLEATREQLKARLEDIKEASIEELQLERNKEAQLIALQKARLETLTAEEMDNSEKDVQKLQEKLSTATGIHREQIALQIALEEARQEEVTGAERDELLARLKMHEDYVWKLADLYSKLPKAVTPEATPDAEQVPVEPLPSLDPGPLPAGGGTDPADAAYDAKVDHTLATARTFQEQMNAMEIEMMREAGREKEALVREEQLELHRIKMEALEAGLLGTKQYSEMEQAVLDYYANEHKALDSDVYAAKVQFAQSFMDALQGIGSLIYGDSERNAKKAFEVDKAMSLASAIVYGGLAINRALATSPWEVAGVAITTAAQVAKIASTKFRSTGTDSRQGGYSPGRTSPTFGLKPSQVQDFHQTNKPQQTGPTVIHVHLEGELDPEMVHIKAKEGEQSISSRTITVKK